MAVWLHEERLCVPLLNWCHARLLARLFLFLLALYFFPDSAVFFFFTVRCAEGGGVEILTARKRNYFTLLELFILTWCFFLCWLIVILLLIFWLPTFYIITWSVFHRHTGHSINNQIYNTLINNWTNNNKMQWHKQTAGSALTNTAALLTQCCEQKKHLNHY